jgi:uncharacterized membrane protein
MALAWLWLWIGMGTALRFWQLAEKPVWTDEFATLVFSLGHSFRTVPLTQILSWEALMAPLRLDSLGAPADVVQHLMTESTHPPLYFLLTHGWLRAFSAAESWVDVGWARSLPVLLGVLTIPAMFGLSWVLFRDRRIAHIAAALMATSPLGIYLAQDARHYTLAMLWEIAGLGFWAIALRHLHRRQVLPRWHWGLWILVNALGLATHYFFGLFLVAQALVIGGLFVWHLWTHDRAAHGPPSLMNPAWRGIGITLVGTVISGIVWLPALYQSRQNELTHWVFVEARSGWDWLDPILNTLISVITMVILLPIQQVPVPVMITAGGAVIGLSVGLGIGIGQGLRRQWQTGRDRDFVSGLLGVIGAAIALFWLLDYGFNTELTGAFRYSFVYLPMVILVVAIGLAAVKPNPSVSSGAFMPRAFLPRGWRAGGFMPLVLILSLLGGVTVSANFGYQKVHRPDRVAQTIQQHSQAAVLISIAHHTHGQTGRLMGVAWALGPPSAQSTLKSQFYLDHQRCEASSPFTCDRPTTAFRQHLMQVPRPADLWLINFQDTADLTPQHCQLDPHLGTQRADGYRYQHYRCAPFASFM